MPTPFSIKYAEPKDIHYTIEILRASLDKLKMNESYALSKLEPSINRMIMQLEEMLRELQKETVTTEVVE